MANDEALDTYEAPQDGWVCFHCGVRFGDADVAERHFGRTPHGVAGCVLLRSEKKQLDAIRNLENDRDEWQERALRAEEREEGLALEHRRVPENESLESVANRVCRDIPDDCEISLCMEWGAGFVTLTKAGRYVNLPDAAEKSLVEQINDALAAARNPEQEDKDDE